MRLLSAVEKKPYKRFFRKGLVGSNNYLYCHNNPINFIDPLGLTEKDEEAEQAAKNAIKKEGWGPGFEEEARNWDKIANESSDTFGGLITTIAAKYSATTMRLASYLDLDYQAQKLTYQTIANQNNMSEDRDVSQSRAGYDAMQLTLNPLTPGAEAIDKTSYQAQDFGRELSGEEQLERGITSLAATSATTAYVGGNVMNAIKGSTMLVNKMKAEGKTTGYHATTPEAADAITEGGFRSGTKPGRLGSGGTYVNDTIKGAVKEFQHHNPGTKPAVIKVNYNKGVNASAKTAPQNYVKEIPVNADTISAPSVRAPGTTNTNINGVVCADDIEDEIDAKDKAPK